MELQPEELEILLWSLITFANLMRTQDAELAQKVAALAHRWVDAAEFSESIIRKGSREEMTMAEESGQKESTGDEKSAGETVFCRCSKQLSMDRQECVKPDGHEPPCDSSTWWCVEHKLTRLGPDCLCINCVDSALSDRWKESVGLQERISNLVDEVGHQWSRIKKLESSEPDRRVEEVLVQSFRRVTTLREVLKLVCQAPTVLSAYRAVMNGKSPVQAMEESLQAVERERVAIVRAEHREARALLHEAFALYEAWKAKQAFYMKSSKLG